MNKLIKVLPMEQLKEIKRGVFELLPEDEFLRKLEKSYKEDKPLKIKLGADPSRPDIHLGHSVVLNKLRILQNFGHEIYFIIGDFTAKIGDPTGKSKTRPILSDEEVKKNAETYAKQIGKILDLSKTKIVFNNDWLKNLTPLDMISLMSKVTVSSLLERDDFSKRYKNNEAIYMHEFIYPLMQGYDSVHLKTDLEVGGTDQTFNLLMGRHLQKQMSLEPQCILTLPILEGTDGVQKMSKSLDNYISLNDSPTDMFGKLMSISDDLMKRYYELLSFKNADEVSKIINGLNDGTLHPMISKKNLAEEITDFYHKGEGVLERQKFEERFSKNKVPDDITILNWEAGEAKVLEILTKLEFISSNGEGRRLLKQNSFKVDFKTHTEEIIHLEKGQEYILKLGKLRMAKLLVN